LTFSNSALGDEHDRVPPIEESCNSDKAKTYGGDNTGRDILDISTGSSTPWRILVKWITKYASGSEGGLIQGSIGNTKRLAGFEWK
jgi:hypothetical protein